MRVFLLLLALAAATTALRPPLTTTTRLPSSYVRPAPSPPLPLQHPRLARAAPTHPHAPEQRMLSLAGPGAVTVTWVTHPEDDARLMGGARDAALARRHRAAGCRHLAGLPLNSVVRYGRVDGGDDEAGLMAVVAAATAGVGANAAASLAVTLPRSTNGSFTCYAADAYRSGALHAATMGAGDAMDWGPLTPGARYVYTVGDPDTGAWSPPAAFTAPPPASTDALPYTIAVIGDLGQTADSEETLAGVAGIKEAGHVLNVGDLSYADGYQPRWDTWGRLVDYHAATVPWMVIEGNHEEELAGSGSAGFVAYNARFAVPSIPSRSNTKLYYSYDVPGAHIVMLGTYADWSAGSPQRAWLAADLASVDRARTPWLLVGMHAPWYSSNTAHLDEVDGMRRSLEPLLLEHGADIVCVGHVHAFERVARVAKRSLNPAGPVHIVIGDGGNREGPATHWLDPAPKWSVVRESSFGFGQLTLANATHAHWTWRRNGDGPDAPPADDAWVVRGARQGWVEAGGALVA